MTPSQLDKAMKTLGYDKKQMADATGVDYSSITRYLKGTRAISLAYEISVKNLILLKKVLANGK